MQVSYDEIAFNTIERRLLEGVPKSFKRVFRGIHTYLIEIERKLFDSKGGTGASGKWAGYGGEPKYAAFKASRTGNPLPVLSWNGPGDLQESLTNRSDPNHYVNVTKTSIAFGSLLPYSKEISQGGRNMFGEAMPARPTIDLRDDQVQSIYAMLEHYIRDPDVKMSELKQYKVF